MVKMSSKKDINEVLYFVFLSRCSSAFFSEERTALRQKRQKMRLLQQRKLSDVSNCKDLPDEIPLPLIIGTKVTGKMTEMKRDKCVHIQPKIFWCKTENITLKKE